MLSWTNPLALWWLALLVGIAALYLIRPRPRVVLTSTLPFFNSLSAVHSESPWLRRLKRLLSFLLSALAVVLATVALARPVAETRDGLATVVVMIDRSAAMAASDEHGVRRIDQALAIARRRIAGLGDGTAVSIIAHDQRCDVVAARTRDRRAVARALDRIAVRPIAESLADRDSAMALAQHLAAAAAPAEIWDISDRPAEARSGTVATIPISVALANPINVGITAAEVRRLPNGDSKNVECYLQMHGVGPAGSVEVKVFRGQQLLSLVSEKISAGTATAPARVRLIMPLPAGGADDVINVRVQRAGDQLALDDDVVLPVPENRTPRVVLVGRDPDPFLTLALAGLAQTQAISVSACAPEAWTPATPADVIVAAGWLPTAWPNIPMVVFDPPRSLAPLLVRRSGSSAWLVDRPQVTVPSHPLLFGVSSRRLRLSQTVAMESAHSMETLWTTEAGGALLAGEIQGSRVVVIGATPSASERLALTASWPMLIANAVAWTVAPRLDGRVGRSDPSGTVIDGLSAPVQWHDGAQQAISNGLVELDRVGVWRSGTAAHGVTMLADAHESCLPSAPTGVEPPQASGVWGGDLLLPIALLLAALLLIESWLMHRRGVF